jgi:UDP-N-acetylglucosamine--N-acetylmuramyl-(pentapeptide) pyrophosphoryl-undecaprenol N-acetylglucosamine transferase
MALGLNPTDPVLLVMGGSQGASGINQLLLRALPAFAQSMPQLQFLHITGHDECEKVKAAYTAQGCRAAVRPFLTEMDLALGAATLAINRAGASSLAELSAMKLPAILVPYPYATDDHQFHNARALVRNGAARLITQATATPEILTQTVCEMLQHPEIMSAMRSALQQWHFPAAARDVAGHIFTRLGLPKPAVSAADEDEESVAPLPAPPSFRPWRPARSSLAVGAEP